MKVAICDDEILYLKYLYNMIKPIIQEGELFPIPPSELYKQVMSQNLPYDIIITDIDLGKLNGIQLAMKINQVNPSCIIIFISNYLNYATEVYDVEHIYFVLKSEAEKRLPKALEKAQSVLKERVSKLLKISYQKTDYLIPLHEIIFIEALGRYLFIHTQNQTYKCIHSLKDISAQLNGLFVRCHNSYIINLSYVKSISKTKCELTNQIDIPISNTFSKHLQSAYISYVSETIS